MAFRGARLIRSSEKRFRRSFPSEELAAGKSYMAAKYFDTCSYSNTFVEKLSDNSVLVLYNNLKYDDGDGLRHKAAFVRKITVER